MVPTHYGVQPRELPILPPRQVPKIENKNPFLLIPVITDNEFKKMLENVERPGHPKEKPKPIKYQKKDHYPEED